jgi:hypothetical protein
MAYKEGIGENGKLPKDVLKSIDTGHKLYKPASISFMRMKEDAKKQLQNNTGIPSLYQAGLYLKQSANLNIASLLIMGLGTGVSFLLPPSGQLPVIASIGLGASITSIISIIKKKKAGKELMLVNMK